MRHTYIPEEYKEGSTQTTTQPEFANYSNQLSEAPTLKKTKGVSPVLIVVSMLIVFCTCCLSSCLIIYQNTISDINKIIQEENNNKTQNLGSNSSGAKI